MRVGKFNKCGLLIECQAVSKSDHRQNNMLRKSELLLCTLLSATIIRPSNIILIIRYWYIVTAGKDIARHMGLNRTVHSFDSVQCTVYSVEHKHDSCLQCIVYTIYYNYTVFTIHSILYTIKYTLYCIHCIINIVYCIAYIVV